MLMICLLAIATSESKSSSSRALVKFVGSIRLMASNGLALGASILRFVCVLLLSTFKAACNAFRTWQALFGRLSHGKAQSDSILPPAPIADLPPSTNSTDSQPGNSSIPVPEQEEGPQPDEELSTADTAKSVAGSPINETEPSVDETEDFVSSEMHSSETPSAEL
jgi:hypothetical protein